MVIAFGIGSYKIKSFKSEELGLNENGSKSFTVQFRQNYFYLFFIPIFGVGKEWVMIENEKKYELPLQYKRVLKEKKTFNK